MLMMTSTYASFTVSNRLSHMVIISFCLVRFIGCHHFMDEEAEMNWGR